MSRTHDVSDDDEAHYDAGDISSDGSDSEGSLVDFIVKDEESDEEFEEEEEEGQSEDEADESACGEAAQ